MTWKWWTPGNTPSDSEGASGTKAKQATAKGERRAPFNIFAIVENKN